MEKDKNANMENKKKGFFGRLAEKIDWKMQEQAKKSSCGCSCSSKKNDKPCCG